MCKLVIESKSKLQYIITPYYNHTLSFNLFHQPNWCTVTLTSHYISSLSSFFSLILSFLSVKWLAKQANQLLDIHSTAPGTHLNPVCSLSHYGLGFQPPASSTSGWAKDKGKTDTYRIEINGIFCSISTIVFKPGTYHATCLETEKEAGLSDPVLIIMERPSSPRQSV